MSTTLTKVDIAGAVYEDIDRSRPEAKKIVESLLAAMKDAIKHDQVLLVTGFGKFEAYTKNARKGRNPATSEPITLKPRTVVVFRVSKKLRDELN